MTVRSWFLEIVSAQPRWDDRAWTETYDPLILPANSDVRSAGLANMMQ